MNTSFDTPFASDHALSVAPLFSSPLAEIIIKASLCFTILNVVLGIFQLCVSVVSIEGADTVEVRSKKYVQLLSFIPFVIIIVNTAAGWTLRLGRREYFDEVAVTKWRFDSRCRWIFVIAIIISVVSLSVALVNWSNSGYVLIANHTAAWQEHLNNLNAANGCLIALSIAPSLLPAILLWDRVLSVLESLVREVHARTVGLRDATDIVLQYSTLQRRFNDVFEVSTAFIHVLFVLLICIQLFTIFGILARPIGLQLLYKSLYLLGATGVGVYLLWRILLVNHLFIDFQSNMLEIVQPDPDAETEDEARSPVPGTRSHVLSSPHRVVGLRHFVDLVPMQVCVLGLVVTKSVMYGYLASGFVSLCVGNYSEIKDAINSGYF